MPHTGPILRCAPPVLAYLPVHARYVGRPQLLIRLSPLPAGREIPRSLSRDTHSLAWDDVLPGGVYPQAVR
jgi:hypothetical protein